MFQAFYTVNGGNELPGNRSTSHNAALRNTRRLFSGEGYRIDVEAGWGAHLILRNSQNTVAIRVERVEA